MSLKVGIFDSGIGGLSILKEIHLLNKSCEIYYIADSSHNPYGSKTKGFILKRCIAVVDEFINSGVELIAIACNTATAVAIDALRERYPQVSFVGIEPYINVINKRSDLNGMKGVILATPLTSETERFKLLKQKLDPGNRLQVYCPPKLAHLIEENFLSKKNFNQELSKELEEIREKYDFYILGCTHYPLILDEMRAILKGELISPCSIVAKRILSFVNTETVIDSSVSFNFKQAGASASWQSLHYQEIF